MADLILRVKPINDILFVPDTLMIRVVASNFFTKISTVYYELTDNNTNTMRVGNMEIPSELLMGTTDSNGVVITSVANSFIGNFNLEIDTTPTPTSAEINPTNVPNNATT